MEGFYVPTAFTPNGDGRNDVFQPMLLGNVKSYRFCIYNRYGDKVFETSDLRKGLDGRIKGWRVQRLLSFGRVNINSKGQKSDLKKVRLC